MDYQNRIGSKKGSGGVASQQEQNIQTKKRVAQLFDISKDPYSFKNHLGQIECKLCFTIHTSSESYLNHISGKKHQLNLQRRSHLEKKIEQKNEIINEKGIQDKSLGLPNYKIMKIRNEETNQLGLFITIKYNTLNENLTPQFRFMTTFEYLKDVEKNDKYQYLIFAFNKFENLSIKISNEFKIDNESIWNYWDEDLKEYYFQFLYEQEQEQEDEQEDQEKEELI